MQNNKCADLAFGLNRQALAVAQLLAGREPDFAEYKDGQYQVYIRTYPWYNGREMGVCFELLPTIGSTDALYIAVFEHRNSDRICALKWTEPHRMNPPTIESSGKLAYPTDDKWDVAHSVSYGKIGKMADWVYEQMDRYYQEKKPKPFSGRGAMLINMKGVDWVMLRKQKRTVLVLVHETKDEEVRDDLMSILHLLDHIQDEAAGEIGEEAVFGDPDE